MCYTNKTNLFTKQLCAASAIFAAFALGSCNDHDFDWEEAHRQNAEYNYEQNFAQIFGEINPNQNWDFTDPTNYDINILSTRADANTATGQDGESITIPGSLRSALSTTLKEGADNRIGESYTLISQGPFDIYPIWHGECMQWTLIVNDGETNYTLGTYAQIMAKMGNASTGYGKAGTGQFTTTGWRVNFPKGTPVYIKLVITKSDTGYAREGQYAKKGDVITSIGKTVNGKNGRKFDYGSVILPENKYTKPKDSEGNDLIDKVIMFEDSNTSASDADFNDLIIAIKGRPAPPDPIHVTPGESYTVEEVLAKRYMVEDMGYSDPSSLAVTNNYTDIDFNDIVVDFEEYRIVTHTPYTKDDGSFDHEDVEYGDWKKRAKVRALGGTWDFKLYVNETVNEELVSYEVFHKDGATQIGKTNKVINDSERGPSKVDFNGSYTIDGTAISRLVAGTMYNTARRSDMHGDGNYPTTTEAFKTSYICDLTSPYINKWNPDANNISFKIIDTEYGEGHNNLYDSNKEDANGDLVSDDHKNVYHFAFPAMGACPKIVAFENTKPWQKEKVHVTTNWFKSDTNTVDQKLDQNIQ